MSEETKDRLLQFGVNTGVFLLGAFMVGFAANSGGRKSRQRPTADDFTQAKSTRKSTEERGYDDWKAGHPSGWWMETNDDYRRGVERAVYDTHGI